MTGAQGIKKVPGTSIELLKNFTTEPAPGKSLNTVFRLTQVSQMRHD